MERQYFAFFSSYFEAIEELPKKYQLAVYRAICLYGLRGEVDENLTGVAKAMFIGFQPALENNRKKSENALTKRDAPSERQAKDKRKISERIAGEQRTMSEPQAEEQQIVSELQANTQQTPSEKAAENDQTHQNDEHKKENIKEKKINNKYSSLRDAPKQKGKSTMVLHDDSATKYINDETW